MEIYQKNKLKGKGHFNSDVSEVFVQFTDCCYCSCLFFLLFLLSVAFFFRIGQTILQVQVFFSPQVNDLNELKGKAKKQISLQMDKTELEENFCDPLCDICIDCCHVD